MYLWAIGEILWDIFASREVLGGAALNFSAHMHRLGHRAELLSAVGLDRRGQLALEQMRGLGLDTRFIQVADDLPTGLAVVGTGSGEPVFDIHRPVAFDRLQPPPGILAEAAAGRVEWIYIGTLLQTTHSIEHFTQTLIASTPSAPRLLRHESALRPLELATGHALIALSYRSEAQPA